MTIDERLESLLKSSESLHANLQEMVSESAARRAEDAERWRDHERRWAEQEERWKEQDRRWEKTDARIDKLTNVMAAIAGTVLGHEERLGGR